MSEATVITLCINVHKFHLQEKVQIYLFILHNHEHIVCYLAIMSSKECIRIHFSSSGSLYNISGLCSMYGISKQKMWDFCVHSKLHLELLIDLIIILEKESLFFERDCPFHVICWDINSGHSWINLLRNFWNSIANR